MKRLLPVFCLAATAALCAQTAPKAPAASKAPAATKSATPAKSATAAKPAATAAGEFPTVYKLPPGEKRLIAPQKKVAVLSYQDIKIGTGAEGEAGKLWHVKYKGWRADDGVVFDNWEDHKQPVRDKDGKPEMDADGKPKMGDPEPLVFPQGMGRLIPGFDSAVAGMRIGGKRRLFIPWQLAYGMRAMPDQPGHPGIPAKSNLIFDVELVSVTDMPPMPARPMRPTPPPGAGGAPPPGAPKGATPGAPAAPPNGTAPAPKPEGTVTGQPAKPDDSRPAAPATQPTPPPSTPPQPK
jgi:peptidylprolyl isomerase